MKMQTVAVEFSTQQQLSSVRETTSVMVEIGIYMSFNLYANCCKFFTERVIKSLVFLFL